MKITKQHHSNSQIHSIPFKDTGCVHTADLHCTCSMQLEMNNGHIMVEHSRMGGRSNKWSVKTNNFGTKLKLK
jgi:bisphosphoglycerate-independent phosphoglycerate mutase (AlkP superfamily)